MQTNSKSDSDALAQGRRIYLGNLLYRIKPSDVEQVLVDNGFADFEKIHISVDPVSARNPGYCFVDFVDAETAERALSSLSASIEGRPVKVGPCEPKKPRIHRTGRFAFQRWGDWGADDEASRETQEQQSQQQSQKQQQPPQQQQGPYGALEHFTDMVQGQDGRRLYVGGLGKMIDQAHNNQELSDIFADFNPTAIGKRITPHERTRALPGNHHYCFVDFATREEAEEAMQALDGRAVKGGRLKVKLAKAFPAIIYNGPPNDEPIRRVRQTDSWRSKDSSKDLSGTVTRSESGSRAMASHDWRRKP